MIAEKSANYPSSPTPFQEACPTLSRSTRRQLSSRRDPVPEFRNRPLPTAPFCILVLKCARASPWSCGTVIAASGPSLREADGISGLFDSVERLCSTVRRSSPC